MKKIIVPPVALEISGCRAYILEVTEHEWVDGKTHYIVTCMVECKGKKSRVFDLDVTSNEELVAKLSVEIARFKLLMMHGLEGATGAHI